MACKVDPIIAANGLIPDFVYNAKMKQITSMSEDVKADVSGQGYLDPHANDVTALSQKYQSTYGNDNRFVTHYEKKSNEIDVAALNQSLLEAYGNYKRVAQDNMEPVFVGDQLEFATDATRAGSRLADVAIH